MLKVLPDRVRGPWVALLAAAALSGCMTLPRAPFTAEQQAVASPIGFDHIRYAEDDPALADMLKRALRPDGLGDVATLAISGGGANGAYGAGLLYGWNRAGGWPQFQLVTGVSTGAMAAPFVFAGPRWSEALRQSYLSGRINGLLRSRGLMGVFTPGLYHKAPLEALVRSWVSDDLLRDIVAENAKGRRLLVATTDLDTGGLVVWDLGAIAARQGPAARDLFVQILVASASVPGVFAPTMIEVSGGGQRFEEMHVDGQADSAFFAIPRAMLLGPTDAQRHHHVFIIVNGQLNEPFAVTPVGTLAILSRTVDVTTKASVRNSLIATQEFCRRNGCDLAVSALPSTQTDSPLDFSQTHVQTLFTAGETAAESGQAWTTTAPAISVKPAPAPVKRP